MLNHNSATSQKSALCMFIVGMGLALLVNPIFGQKNVYSVGLGDCGGGYLYKDESNPFTFTAPSGQTITKITIKAGSQNQGQACFDFISNGSNGCYSVVGIGTQTATAVKIGSGPSCKDISHAEFYGGISSTPTPTPTPTVTPTVTPTPTPTVTPTPTPTVTPTPTPTITPTPTPTECPRGQIFNGNLNVCIDCDGGGTCEVTTNDPTPTPTPTPTVTPTPTPTDSGTNSSSSSNSGSTSTGGTGGQILGATTLGNTGSALDIASIFATLTGLTLSGSSLYGLRKKSK